MPEIQKALKGVKVKRDTKIAFEVKTGSKAE
jgi:hypothetical protein